MRSFKLYKHKYSSMEFKQIMLSLVFVSGIILSWKRVTGGLDHLVESRWWIYMSILLILCLIWWRRCLGLKGKWQEFNTTQLYDKSNDAALLMLKNRYVKTSSKHKHDDEDNDDKPKDSKGEIACREHLERRFGMPFTKIRPSWLVNPKTKARLELDCYNELLNLALEYNGKQHYEYVDKFHKCTDDLDRQKQRDVDKRRICKEKGIDLIEVPYTIDFSDIPTYIDGCLIKMGRIQIIEK
ncbi:Uvr/REP helicase [Trichoplusia ni ascovirus 6b]|nr:Uvr/REP helicase [Trichoplusia ni ascovirus 6b]